MSKKSLGGTGSKEVLTEVLLQKGLEFQLLYLIAWKTAGEKSIVVPGFPKEGIEAAITLGWSDEMVEEIKQSMVTGVKDAVQKAKILQTSFEVPKGKSPGRVGKQGGSQPGGKGNRGVGGKGQRGGGKGGTGRGRGQKGGADMFNAWLLKQYRDSASSSSSSSSSGSLLLLLPHSQTHTHTYLQVSPRVPASY